MFTSRRRHAETVAADAWDHLLSAVSSVSGSAKSAGQRGSRLAEETGSRVGSTADEAWKRASAAMDALAGRRPGLPWGLIAGAAVAGVAIGFAVAASLRAARTEIDELTPAPAPTTESVHLDAP
jgi:ElaB/YqjD/DUF883 family membrane-anchored ribosome-binding protein